MFTPFTLWKSWKTISDQALADSLDFARRGRKMAELQLGPPPDVGQTPADVVYTEGTLRLLHYRAPEGVADPEKTHRTPVLLVPSIINRYYILDLKPGRSLAAFLLGAGYDVWIIDWGSPGIEDKDLTLDEHIDGRLHRCVEHILAETGEESLSLLGYCIGGVLAALYTALHADKVRNLVTLTTPIDFHDDGLLSLWTKKEVFPVDLLIDTYGNMPAWLLQTSFKWLRPSSEAANFWTLWDRLDNPARLDDFRALNHWLEDNIGVAGETYRKFVKDCYQDNLLRQNLMEINGRAADLSGVRTPLLNVVARRDHIAPCDSAAVLNDLVGGEDVTLLQLEGGHIGAIVGRDAKESFWPQLDAWLAKRS